MRKGKSKDKGCCRNKVILSLASLIMLIALALGVSAMASSQIQISPSYLSQDTKLIINYSGNGGDPEQDIDAIAITLISTSTANSTERIIYNRSNSTNENLMTKFHLNETFGLNYSFEDSTDYTAKAYIYFNTTEVSNSLTSVTVDRTVSQRPTSVSPSGKQTSRTQTIQATVNGANTTSCRLTFTGSNPGSVTYTMTHSGNNCSQSFSNLASTTFRYTISASDGTNRSAETAEATFNVDIAGASGARKYIVATSGGRSLPTQASSTAQQRAGGQQAQDALDRAIAKAPVNAQEGLTKAKEAVTKQYKGFEAVKTWTGTGIGCVAGFAGLALGPLGLVTIPVGCVGGHLFGMVI